MLLIAMNPVAELQGSPKHLFYGIVVVKNKNQSFFWKIKMVAGIGIEPMTFRL